AQVRNIVSRDTDGLEDGLVELYPAGRIRRQHLRRLVDAPVAVETKHDDRGAGFTAGCRLQQTGITLLQDLFESLAEFQGGAAIGGRLERDLVGDACWHFDLGGGKDAGSRKREAQPGRQRAKTMRRSE